jgi:hypothetical protein
VVDTYDPAVKKTTALTVASIDEQDGFESRRAWKKVADAIVKGDMDTTSHEKSIIENRQRVMRKQEKDEGREWERRFFSKTDNYPVFKSLAAKIGEDIRETSTNGVWVFDAEKASQAKPPFHPDVNPPVYEEVRTSAPGAAA